MIVTLALALACAAPADRITIEVPSLAASEKGLGALLEWAALVEPDMAPSALSARVLAQFGVNPLSASSMLAAGVDPTKPIRAIYEGRQIVVEAQLADLDRARAHLTRVQGKSPALTDATGFVAGDSPISALAVVIKGDKVFALLGLDRRPPLIRTASSAAALRPSALAKDPRLELLRRAMAGKNRVDPPKSLGTGDLWAVIQPKVQVERVDVVVRAPPERITIDFEAVLGMAGEVALNEAMRGRSSARRKVDAGPLAFELTTTLTKAGLRALLGRAHYPEAWASSLAGPIQIGMAADGTLYAAADLDPKVDPGFVEIAKKRIGEDIEVKAGVLWARSGPTPLRAVKSSTSTRGAMAIDVSPPQIFRALERHKARFGLRSMDLMMAQLLVGKVFGATKWISLDLSLPTNRLRGTIAIIKNP